MLIIDFVLMTFMFIHPYTYMAFKKKTDQYIHNTCITNWLNQKMHLITVKHLYQTYRKESLQVLP